MVSHYPVLTAWHFVGGPVLFVEIQPVQAALQLLSKSRVHLGEDIYIYIYIIFSCFLHSVNQFFILVRG